MDIASFYGFFSATCFTLLGLWWNVVQGHPGWLRDERLRHAVGGVYLAFFLPALMGLFAQVGGASTPSFWRISFVAVALVGLVATVRLLGLTREGSASAAPLQAVAAALYLVVGLVGVAPGIVDPLGLSPIQAEAMLLIVLIVIAHGLVWEFLRRTATAPDTPPAT
ncbi:MAG: hypothetical protein KDB63_09120 [Nocardioidaceae bacterium]|nr:hypothetical protein [Nocardioidaceae bacterium]